MRLLKLKTFLILLTVKVNSSESVITAALKHQINLRLVDSTHIGISLNETATINDAFDICKAVAEGQNTTYTAANITEQNLQTLTQPQWPQSMLRQSAYMTHAIFNTHHSETELFVTFIICKTKM